MTHSIHRGIGVAACDDCGKLRFSGAGSRGDTWDAMSKVFGNHELVGRVDAVLAPAPEVLAYRERCGDDHEALRVTPPHRWFRVNDHLWMCHDGTLLLLAHGSASVSRMVGA